MPHERTSIREAVVAQLVAGSTVAAARVYGSRLKPVTEAELPAILVYTDSETVDPASAISSPRWLKRTLELTVEGLARVAEDLQTTLDDLALEIETAMDSDLEFGETAFSSALASSEIGMKVDGNQPIGMVRLVYNVVYETDLRVAARDSAMDDLSTVDIRYSLENEQDDEDDQAHDTIEDLET